MTMATVATQTEATPQQYAVEQQIVAEIQKLWPKARKSAKELGEQLARLRDACKDSGDRFGTHLKALGIPRSSAYNLISVYEECLVVDFVFPNNVVKFAATANVDVTDLGNRKVLMHAYRDIKSSQDPTDGEAISIVGSAAAAIAAAAAKVNSAPGHNMTPLQECLAEQDSAFKNMYRLQTKGTKANSTQRSAAEGQYVKIAHAFLHPSITSHPSAVAKYRLTESGYEKIEGSERANTIEEIQQQASHVRDLLLRLGRGETTLYREFQPLVDQALWFF